MNPSDAMIVFGASMVVFTFASTFAAWCLGWYYGSCEGRDEALKELLMCPKCGSIFNDEKGKARLEAEARKDTLTL